jgi:hypothetical protein
MFRQIARAPQQGFETHARALFQLHPLVLTAMVEHGWALRRNDSNKEIGDPHRRSVIESIPAALIEQILRAGDVTPRPEDPVGVQHLIYAHMIENTGVLEMCRKLVQRHVTGNLEGVSLHPDSQAWLRTTEELFFRNPPGLTIQSLVSEVRPDLRATRRNAYWRMFGMDLVHGEGGEGKPYPYPKSQVANTDFRDTWKQLLIEVWVGISNLGNTSGPKVTDDAAIADLAEKLSDMLRTRRRDGQLAREEFQAVTMMSWFHLALEFDSPIVKDLGATALGPEERLVGIASFLGEEIGDRKSRLDSFFDLADPMSTVLLLIEEGVFSDAGSVPALYTPGALEVDMKDIIRAWSAATGDNIKGGAVAAGRKAPIGLAPA